MGRLNPNVELLESEMTTTPQPTDGALRAARIAYVEICPAGLNTRALEAAIDAYNATAQLGGGVVSDETKWRDLMFAIVTERPRRSRNHHGDAPGHSHSVAGIWDSDNGVLAGKECAWCKAWREAESALGKGGA